MKTVATRQIHYINGLVLVSALSKLCTFFFFLLYSTLKLKFSLTYKRHACMIVDDVIQSIGSRRA